MILPKGHPIRLEASPSFTPNFFSLDARIKVSVYPAQRYVCFSVLPLADLLSTLRPLR